MKSEILQVRNFAWHQQLALCVPQFAGDPLGSWGPRLKPICLGYWLNPALVKRYLMSCSCCLTLQRR